MSKQRSQKGKTEVYSTSEDSSLATPLPEGTDPESLLFPEFSDQDINLEKWDSNTPGKDKSIQNNAPLFYSDPHQINLPSGLVVNEWKRCTEIFNASFVVYSTLTEYPDLITPNLRLLKVEFYRCFISTIESLLYISGTKPFPIEYGNSGYYTLEQHRPWRPWYHIYSNCKINKGEHSSTYNPAGKYVVRLFWLGTWRKIYVDDKLPVDNENKLLLPSLYKLKKVLSIASTNEEAAEKHAKSKSKPSTAKRETIEIWPMILCKALLKLASLTRSKINKFNDFDIITCLTGWIPQKIQGKGISSNDLWDILTAYVDHFEWPDNKDGSTKKTGSTKKSKETVKKGVKEAIPAGIENMRDGHRFVILSCNNSESQDESNPITYSYISQVRDIPLNPTPPRPELEFWKTFRYEKWATEHGIIPPDIKKLNIKSLKLVDCFRRFDKGVKEMLGDSGEFGTADVDNIDKKSDKSSKSSKKISKDVKTLEPDPSMWLDLKAIKQELLQVTIYYQPRGFKSKYKISDINFDQKTYDFKQIVYPYIPKHTGNDAIYVFLDSIDYKFLLLNLTHEGDRTALYMPQEEEVQELKGESLAEEMDICEEIVLTKTKHDSEHSRQSDDPAQKKSVYGFKSQPVSLVLEDYHWDLNVISQTSMSINTYGTKSLLVGINPGRKSYRIWISSATSYVLQVFSDTPITIGCREEYLLACGEESQMLTNLCYELGSGFGRLVQSFGLPEHPMNLRNFYQCYKPIQQLSKKELALIHKVFFNELCKIIAEKSTVPNGVEVVKLLFLQLRTFDYINPYTETPHLYPERFERNDQVEYAKIMQRSAVKIQAFFKRVYVRLVLKKLHDFKLYAELLDILRKIYQEVFAADKRVANCSILIRRFFDREEIKPIRHKFEIYIDLDSVLDLHIFSGNMIISEQMWVPMCRYEFAVMCEDPIAIKIDLFSNLKNCSVRVFDNNSLEEFRWSINNMLVHNYSKNENGYTVLCYGWSDFMTKNNYKLIIAHKKASISDIVQIPNTLLITQSIKDQYIPNCENVISRHIIKVYSSVYLTANLTTSFDKVNICLRILDKKRNVIKETLGIRTAILPILYLNFIQSESEPGTKLKEMPSKELKVTNSSAYSDITYSKLYKRHTIDSFDTRSIRSSSIKSGSVGIDPELTGKRPRKKSSQEKAGDDRSLIHHHSDTSEVKIQLSKKSHKSISSRTSDNASKPRSNSKPIVIQTKATEGANYTEYILEAKVVGDSWPLTADEYKRVQKIREKNYLNLLSELKQMSSRKLISKKNSLTIEEPYWILDLLYVSEDGVEFVKDRSQVERKKQVKSVWFQNIERYRRAMELRGAYLENYLIERDIEIDKTKRSNDSTDFATKIIKDEPFEQYYIETIEPIDEECCKIKREEDYIIDEAAIDHEIKLSKADQQGYTEEIEGRLVEQQEDFTLLNKWFEEIKIDTQEMLANAIGLKKMYFEKVSKDLSKEKSGKKGKEKKK